MSLDEQIQQLIDEAPQDGSTPQLVAAIAPVLRALATRLRHSHYYIVQTLNQDWAMTRLSNSSDPSQEKSILYAYPTLQDVALSPYPMQDPQLIALPIPSTHILFQMLALQQIDSAVFFETPGNVDIGIEVRREELDALIQMQLQQSRPSSVPHDIA